MPELSVEISGSIEKLEKSLKKGESALKTFEKKADNISKSLESNALNSSKLSKQIDNLKASYNSGGISQTKFEKSLKSLQDAEKKVETSSKSLRSELTKVNQQTKALGGGGMNTLKKGTISGNAAMTAFSRTIQDAPFGIMGVSNNITNLTEQFGYLKNKTGSAKGALVAMLKDLKGFGGISLAISAATSLMLVFGDKIFKTKDKAKLLREEQDKLTKSLDDYIFQMAAVDKANLKGSQSAAKQIVKLNLLKKQIEDTNLSNKERLKGVNELRRIYPSYLKNITDEKALNGGLKKTYDRLTSSILKRAKATASMSSIVENTKKILALESQREDNITKSDEALKKSTLFESQAQSATKGGLELINQLRKESADKINESTKALKDNLTIQKQIDDLNSKNAKLTKNVSIEGGIVGDILPNDTERKDVFIDFKLDDSSFAVLEEIDLSNNEWIGDSAFDWDNYFKLKELDEKSNTLKEKLLKLNENIKGVISNQLSNTFSQLGDAIGTALSNGGNVLQAIGTTILQGLGNFLSKMGGMLIEYGTLAVVKGKLDLAIAAGGAVAIGAGIAAIAVGVALKAAGAAFSSSANSNNSSGVSNDTANSSYQSSTSSSSSSGYSSSNSGLQNVVFEIQGTKLVGVINNTLRRNRSLGGQLSLSN